MSVNTLPAAVEALFMVAFPGDAPHPSATVTTLPGGIEIVLDGDESPLFRVMALALLADTLGDEDPEVIPGVERYVCGTWADTTFLVRCPITSAQQVELTELALRMVAGTGE